MRKDITKDKTWLALLISAILGGYYIAIQDFIEVNSIVAAAWGILNLALVYRLVASICSSKKEKTEETK